ncbi:MAG: ABC transporter ATP-binding protein, partial [Deltaproteobacteria bacterium]|nr:ABC transporter ATP-binding protein [Deltaproteobacteria bacterium]
MAGLTEQDSGSVSIGGRDVSNLSPDKRRIGFVFQDHALFPHLTVFDNVAYGLRVRRLKGHEITRKVEYYLSKVSIAKEKNKFPGQLSGGQKQRVALARALVIEPEILLMDEPMSSLDFMTKETIRNELKSIQQDVGVTTVYVTHDQSEAVLLGDRVSVLNNGKVEQIESPSELFYHPKTEFVARFIGIKNILKVSLIGINNHEATVQINNNCPEYPIRIRVKKYPIFEKRKMIDMCIHPEKIMLKREDEASDGNVNRIKGKVVKRTNNGNGFMAIVDIGGTILHAAIPTDFDCKVYENVWVCFAPDAPHPLCGKKCRAAETKRRCLKE